MTSILYQITMGTGLVLSVNGNDPVVGSQLILNSPMNGNKDQLWDAVYYPPTAGVILLNPHRGFYAAPASLDDGAPVVLFAPPGNLVFTPAQTWAVVSDAPFVVRSSANENRNLNASGSDWYPVKTKIIVFHWGHGKGKNDTWNFRPVIST